MDFKKEEFRKLMNTIINYRDAGENWEDIRTLEKFSPMDMDTRLFFISKESKFDNLTLKIWEELVDYLKKEESGIETVKIASSVRMEVTLPTDPDSQWVKYKQYLQDKKFSGQTIAHIQESSKEILSSLSMDTEFEEPVKGLVIGNVQSGKTANMAGLISLAADHGFNYFIVFTGIIDSLRKQTEDRLYSDMNIRNGKWNWNLISNPKIKSGDIRNKWENINLTGNDRHLTVSLKNSKRMDELIKWLYSDKNKLKEMKVLIIDDEADQASVNASGDLSKRTAINKHMIRLVHGIDNKKFKATNFISYTATPFANILSEAGSNTLYPKDFIFSLTPSEDYLGPSEMFQLMEPETLPAINIVRRIPDKDNELIKNIHKENSLVAPESLKKAIDWFFLASCVMRHQRYKKPISMLIHTSMRMDDHDKVANVVKEYIENIRLDIDEYLSKLEKMYNQESLDFSLEDFKEGMSDYSSLEEVKDYPSWEHIKNQLLRVLNITGDENYLSHMKIDDDGRLTPHHGFHIAIDNSNPKSMDESMVEKEMVKLVYPESKLDFAPMYIVIGGNTLSRGLTIEGLVSSYFIRTTNQADTLMQMGRWFGFRKGYELLPRVFLTDLTRQRFEFLAQMNEELRSEIALMGTRGVTPKEYAVRVKNSPNQQFIRITSKNKMLGSEEVEIDFTGFNKQTYVFKNNKKDLELNIRLTKNLLENMPVQAKKSFDGNVVWRGIPYEIIREYFANFKFNDAQIDFSNIDALLAWFENVLKDNPNSFSDWNVIMVTPNNDNNTDYWEIDGFKMYSSSRSRRGDVDSQGNVSIGALRSPLDLYSDLYERPELSNKELNKMETILNMREEQGLGTVPQLILYRIDKQQMSNEAFFEDKYKGKDLSNRTTPMRYPLNFSEDIIGMNILIPGELKKGNKATKVSVVLPTEWLLNGESDKEEE